MEQDPLPELLLLWLLLVLVLVLLLLLLLLLPPVPPPEPLHPIAAGSAAKGIASMTKRGIQRVSGRQRNEV